MRRLTCAIVEDEPLAIQMLDGYISRRPDLILISVINNIPDFQAITKTTSHDIVFLDFKIPGFDGDIAKILDRISPTSLIISTSASPISFFNESEKTEASSQVVELLKPFSFERFSACIDSLLQTNNTYL
ncbi:LytTR family DNA-binding domain-containing protein [Olivibacter sp. XZL3]|uniref:LytR/AlgR family response regulator transcription factor n=1 Tax=Olivibacter sp. XZL3 TaxID=1735116 RepID=UPI0010670C5D|nr:response regulator [Olivibacter sp. XZL3]